MKIRWLANARENLEAELLRIAEEDKDAATRIALYVKERTELLGKYPESGRPGRVQGTRELVLTGLPYVLPYRVRANTVEILRFFHTSQNPPAKW